MRDFAIAGYHRYSASIITEDWSFIHWTRPDERKMSESLMQIYGMGMAEHSAHLATILKGDDITANMLRSAAEERLRRAATLDGEDQWTCTPGSVAEVPEKDELFDRKSDPFQLNNIANKDPKKAAELYETLREFMAELRTS